MSVIDDEVVREFLTESREGLDRLDNHLIALEQNPDAADLLPAILRVIHSIKGTGNFFGFSKLEMIMHAGEDLLGEICEGRIKNDSEITSALLRMDDAVRKVLATIEAGLGEGAGDHAELIGTLHRLQKTRRQSGSGVEEKRLSRNDVSLDTGDSLGEVLLKSGMVRPADLAAALRRQRDGDPRLLGEILLDLGAVKPRDLIEAVRFQAEVRASTIRVDVRVLDTLMRLAGLLTLERDQVLRLAASLDEPVLSSVSRRLDQITAELQDAVMKARMQPVFTLWRKFPRVVRDLAASYGKKVRIETKGQEIELDKMVIEVISDPLTHLVRNAIGHGIETPEVRIARGKPEEGRLFLGAFKEGEQIIIEVTDDGAVIDVEQVKQKALQRGLVSHERAAQMTERELLDLVFLFGFSLAEEVTNLSGRGVGLDIVRTDVEKIGGTVDIESRLARGTTLKLRVPSTPAAVTLSKTGATDPQIVQQDNTSPSGRSETG